MNYQTVIPDRNWRPILVSLRKENKFDFRTFAYVASYVRIFIRSQ